MTRSLRIAVADDEPDMRDWFRTILPLLGHEVVAVAEDGRDLIEKCRATRPRIGTAREGPRRSSNCNYRQKSIDCRWQGVIR